MDAILKSDLLATDGKSILDEDFRSASESSVNILFAFVYANMKAFRSNVLSG